jgi:hypothetical protein
MKWAVIIWSINHGQLTPCLILTRSAIFRKLLWTSSHSLVMFKMKTKWLPEGLSGESEETLEPTDLRSSTYNENAGKTCFHVPRWFVGGGGNLEMTSIEKLHRRKSFLFHSEHLETFYLLLEGQRCLFRNAGNTEVHKIMNE